MEYQNIGYKYKYISSAYSSSELSSFLGELLTPVLSGELTTSPSAEYLMDMDTLSVLPFIVPSSFILYL